MDSTTEFVYIGGPMSSLGRDQAAGGKKVGVCPMSPPGCRLDRPGRNALEIAIKHKRLTKHDLFKSLRAASDA